LPQTDESNVEVEPLSCELVVEAILPGTVRDGLEDPFFDKLAKAIRQNVAGDAEALMEFLEPMKTQEGVADDQQGPPLADKLERTGYRAILVLILAVQHTP
jgi:hypothetical protein